MGIDVESVGLGDTLTNVVFGRVTDVVDETRLRAGVVAFSDAEMSGRDRSSPSSSDDLERRRTTVAGKLANTIECYAPSGFVFQ